MLADEVLSLVVRNVRSFSSWRIASFVNLLELQLDIFELFVDFSDFSIGFYKPALKYVQEVL